MTSRSRTHSARGKDRLSFRYRALASCLPLAVTLSAALASAAIPEPDAIRYGSIAVGGIALAPGQTVVARNESNSNEIVGQYTIPTGASPPNLYVARIKLASTLGPDPIPPFKAKVGDVIRFWVGSSADDDVTTIGSRAEIIELDLDIPAGTACGNGSVSLGEQCDAGAANGSPGSCCTAACTFVAAGTACADDGNVCTTNSCNGAGSCAADPVPDETVPCADDGNVCTRDVCVAGACGHPPAAPGTPCADDGNVCTIDVCSFGACSHPAGPDGTACADDGIECTRDECVAGACQHPAEPDGTQCAEDGNTCSDDVCSGGTCAHPAKADASPCSDGAFCNGTESCAAGVCQSGTGTYPCAADQTCVEASDSCTRACALPGDCTGNGQRTAGDLGCIRAWLLQAIRPANPACADCTGGAGISSGDLGCVRACLLTGTCQPPRP